MTRITRTACFAVLVAVGWLILGLGSCERAAAQPPDRLDHYRFIPRKSVLEVTGGFAGIEFFGNIHGSFDFLTGFRHGSDGPIPTLEPYAAFANVDAVAISPVDFGPYSFDIEASLNLSGLDGKPLPAGPLFDLYRFEGREPQGGAVLLHALRIGGWLLFGGGSEAPPNTADLFEYQIRAITRQTPFADFNADDRVDNADLDVWESDFRAARLAGVDLLAAQRQQGEVMPSFDELANAVAGGAAAVGAVPEPGCLGMALFGCCVVALRRRR